MTKTRMFLLTLIVGLALASLVSLRFEGKPAPDIVLEEETIREDDVETATPDPESFVEGEGPYQDGYKIGYMTFKFQNEDVPLPIEIRYASYENEEDHRLSEDYHKGYVDGYHKATEMIGCVSGGCPY